MHVKVEAIHPNAILPKRAHSTDAAFDIYSVEAVRIPPARHEINNPVVSVPTGLVFELPTYSCGLILPRSGIAFKSGVTVINAPGLLDADYRGELKVGLINHSDTPYWINAGDRIAQIMFIRLEQQILVEGSVNKETSRGAAGIGSTGR